MLSRHSTWQQAASIAAAIAMLAACSTRVTPPAPEVKELGRRVGAVTVVSVGDILLAAEGEPRLRRHGYAWAFDGVRPLLAGADLVIGNLEGPITDAREPIDPKRKFFYKMPREAAAAIAGAGFRALSFANNHTMDYRVEGMVDTIETVRAHGMETFGAGLDEAAARRGVVYDLGSVRIGLLSYAAPWRRMKALDWYADGDHPGAAPIGEVFDERMGRDIARMRAHADVVIVCLHWGRNYRDRTRWQQAIGRRAIDLGADVVNGHHPHIVQGIEIYNGKPIIYSLGNFVFTTFGRFEEMGKPGYGLVARMVFEGSTLAGLELTPIAVDNRRVHYQARRISEREARAALWPQLARYGTKARWRGDTAYIDVVSR